MGPVGRPGRRDPWPALALASPWRRLDAGVGDPARRGFDRKGQARQEWGSDMSWRGHHEPDRRALTGYSHGAAGAGVALVELGAAVREDTFKETGLAAFAYERRLYSAAQANWPDFRRSGGGRSRIAQQFSTAWCHGAPGIALSRLRAMQLAPTREIASELHAALRTTSQATAAMLNASGTSFCLCH